MRGRRRVMDRAGELGVARAKALEQAKAFREAKAKADEERR